MQREVSAQARVGTNSAAPQQSWRLGGSGGDDDRVRENIDRRPVGPTGPHPAGAPVLVQHPLDAGVVEGAGPWRWCQIRPSDTPGDLARR